MPTNRETMAIICLMLLQCKRVHQLSMLTIFIGPPPNSTSIIEPYLRSSILKKPQEAGDISIIYNFVAYARGTI